MSENWVTRSKQTVDLEEGVLTISGVAESAPLKM